MATRTRTEVRSSHLRSYALGDDRVALVPETAVLLADDAVTVSVRVAAGARLEVVEPGGTVAYAMRGATARWDVDLVVEAGGLLVWRGEPFVVAEGADVHRSLTAELADGAELVIRETLVLGRTAEAPGLLRSRSEVSLAGQPVLVEELDSRVGLGGHRVVHQLLHVGGGPCRPTGHTLVLEVGGHLDRWLGPAAHASPVGGCQSSASPE